VIGQTRCSKRVFHGQHLQDHTEKSRRTFGGRTGALTHRVSLASTYQPARDGVTGVRPALPCVCVGKDPYNLNLYFYHQRQYYGMGQNSIFLFITSTPSLPVRLRLTHLQGKSRNVSCTVVHPAMMAFYGLANSDGYPMAHWGKKLALPLSLSRRQPPWLGPREIVDTAQGGWDHTFVEFKREGLNYSALQDTQIMHMQRRNTLGEHVSFS